MPRPRVASEDPVVVKGLDRPIFLLEVDPCSKEARELEVMASHRVSEWDADVQGLRDGEIGRASCRERV